MNNKLTLSVHQLVDFLLREGDIDSRVFNRTTMSEGTRLHQHYQKNQDSNYFAEYPLKISVVVEEVEVELSGRADGIIKYSDNTFCIDEIKTTVDDLEVFQEQNEAWHLGQAKCYAFMFASEKNLSSIGVKLTYIKQGNEKETLSLDYTFKYLELKKFFYSLIEDYISFYQIIIRHNKARNNSINELVFPFSNYRKGQKDLAKYCYAVTKNGGRFFCEAPTGIGKTMSTLFPFIKSLLDDDQSKIFYLTAKTSGRDSAAKALNILKNNGLILNYIIITAKDKICFCKDKTCNPEDCPFARNYYNKLRAVVTASLLNDSTFSPDTIIQIAKEHQVCPFELELDLSLFCDAIICDYNYLFNPTSYMKRYFDEDSSHFLALIDEAHNLVDRSRDMYSARISYSDFLNAKKSIRHSKNAKLKRVLSKLNAFFKEYLEMYSIGDHVVDNFQDDVYKKLNRFVVNMQDISKDDSKDVSKELLNYYLDVNQFLKISDYYSPRYLSYFSINDKENISFNLFCMDPSIYLNKITNTLKASVFFSATFSPIDYFINTLGGDSILDSSLILSSPFPKENLCVMIAPKVSIRYKNREKSYGEVREYISSFIKNKVGNYFVYVPSYEYLDNLMCDFVLENADVFIQTKDMSDQEKEEFLLHFQSSPTKTSVGFMVIGGAFSEGIDLVSDRLIGAVIVGIGLPKINFESDNIAAFFNHLELPGHDYAYLNPGMNKVMQAIGRVIRSETDKGCVLLIDERYLYEQYRKLFKIEWSNYEVVLTPKEVEERLLTFFK